MEAAAKQVHLLTQRILPDRPHHLSYSAARRYRAPPDDAKVFEEEIYRGLQYMTFVSDADRGVLLTRSYYDMREDPPSTSNTTGHPVVSDKKPSTKISLSDYKNKQKKQSQSPPCAPDQNLMRDPLRQAPAESKLPPDLERRNGRHSEGSQRSRDARPPPHDAAMDEKSSKISHRRRQSAADIAVSPDPRKRQGDDEGLRPPKRAKPDTNGTFKDKSPAHKEEVGQELSRKKYTAIQQDRSPGRGSRAVTTPSMANGRGILKAAMSSGHGSSPNARSREHSLNGPRPSSRESANASPHRTTTTTSGRSAVPPLLSPLNLSFEDAETHQRGNSRGLEDSRENRGHRSIPPLLSPTLPPLIEAELARTTKKAPTKESETRNGVDSFPDPASGGRKEKARSSRPDEDDGRDRKRRLMVTLKYPKRVAKTVQRLLALPPKKDTSIMERSVSTESAPPESNQPRKRPVASTDPPTDAAPKRRPGNVDTASASRPAAPSTPVKHPMSTFPSDSPANPSGPAQDRSPPRPSSGGTSAPAMTEDVRRKTRQLKERYRQYEALGKSLKRERDRILREVAQELNGPATSTSARAPGQAERLATMKGIEAILSFMTAFEALGKARRLSRQPSNAESWASLLGLLDVVLRHSQQFGAMKGFAWQLKAFCLEEICNVFSTWNEDMQGPLNTGMLLDYNRQRSSTWRAVFKESASIPSDEKQFRCDCGPWTVLSSIATTAPDVMGRWASMHRVEWEAMFSYDTIPDQFPAGHS